MDVSGHPGFCVTRAREWRRTFDRKNNVREFGSIGTRPPTAKGRPFELMTAAIAERYVAWLSYSGSEPRLLVLLGECGTFAAIVCSTSNSDMLCERGTESSEYRLGVGEDMLEAVERGIVGGRIGAWTSARAAMADEGDKWHWAWS